MRPNSKFQRKLISSLKRDDIVVYFIPSGESPLQQTLFLLPRPRTGTRLPDNLFLVHERGDHYALQTGRFDCCVGVRLRRHQVTTELNPKVTDFMKEHGNAMTQDAWLKAYGSAA